MANRWVKSGKFGALGSKITADGDFLFLGSKIFYPWAPKSPQMVTAAMKLKDACSLEESYDKPRQHIKKQRYRFANKGQYSQSYAFSSSHVWM